MPPETAAPPQDEQSDATGAVSVHPPQHCACAGALRATDAVRQASVAKNFFTGVSSQWKNS